MRLVRVKVFPEPAPAATMRGRSKVVMVVCRKRETATILKFVKTIDPNAFMSVGSVMGVYGKGFQAISKP